LSLSCSLTAPLYSNSLGRDPDAWMGWDHWGKGKKRTRLIGTYPGFAFGVLYVVQYCCLEEATVLILWPALLYGSTVLRTSSIYLSSPRPTAWTGDEWRDGMMEWNEVDGLVNRSICLVFYCTGSSCSCSRHMLGGQAGVGWDGMGWDGGSG